MDSLYWPVWTVMLIWLGWDGADPTPLTTLLLLPLVFTCTWISWGPPFGTWAWTLAMDPAGTSTS